jgi:hypothetical protein
MDWISIKDQKPPVFERVLCYVPPGYSGDDVMQVLTYYEHSYEENRKMMIFRGIDRSWTEDWITHWMPLPSPPAENHIGDTNKMVDKSVTADILERLEKLEQRPYITFSPQEVTEGRGFRIDNKTVDA